MVSQLPPSALLKSDGFTSIAELSERFNNLDVSQVLVYMVDIVQPQLLPILAEQFHVLGDEGWWVAKTEEQKRALIKKSIELHRKKGTVWAVKAIFEILGVNAELKEWFEQTPAAAPYSFSVVAWANDNLNDDGTPILTEALYTKLKSLINEFKAARSGYSFAVGAKFKQPLIVANASQCVTKVCDTHQPTFSLSANQSLKVANAAQVTAMNSHIAELVAYQPESIQTHLMLVSAMCNFQFLQVTMEVA